MGVQLDSLIDLVGFSVAPALLLLQVGQLSAWFLPGAFLVLAAGVIRLSYFNVFGPLDDSTYRGLSLDNNIYVLALFFAFEPLIAEPVFAVVLYGAMVLGEGGVARPNVLIPSYPATCPNAHAIALSAAASARI